MPMKKIRITLSRKLAHRLDVLAEVSGRYKQPIMRDGLKCALCALDDAVTAVSRMGVSRVLGLALANLNIELDDSITLYLGAVAEQLDIEIGASGVDAPKLRHYRNSTHNTLIITDEESARLTRHANALGLPVSRLASRLVAESITQGNTEARARLRMALASLRAELIEIGTVAILQRLGRKAPGQKPGRGSS